MFWNGHPFHPSYRNVLGIIMPSSGPVLAPLWFLRDLMVIIFFAPLLYWFLCKMGRILLLLLGGCYLFNIWIPLSGFSVSCTFWFSVGVFFSINRTDIVGWFRRCCWVTYPFALFSMLVLLFLRCTLAGPEPLALHLLHVLYVVAAVCSAVSLAGFWQSSGLPGIPSWLIRSTFFIYLSHILIREQVLRLFLPLYGSHNYAAQLVAYFLVPLLTVVVCVALWQVWQTIKTKRFFNSFGSQHSS